jgi:cell division protein FtsB
VSQAANTFWDERVQRIDAGIKISPMERRRVRVRRAVDAIILAIILAAAATCVSVYSRARAELDAALSRHQAAGAKVQDLQIKIEKLERDVKQMRDDSRVIELFARQKYGFVRSGDVVIKLPEEQSAPAKSEDGIRVANLTPRASGEYTDVSN